MRCLAVCQDELVIRMLDEILLPGFDVEFIVESRPVARRLHDAKINAVAGDPRRADTFVKADIGPSTCAIIEDNARRSLKKLVDAVRAAGRKDFERTAMVDVQTNYFGGLIHRFDLASDHHPEQPGYSSIFKDIRADYGSTCTSPTEHPRAVDVNISERTATAMLYAIKSDTLFFARQTNRVDLEAFSFLYPLADPALIRKMEGAEITLERLDHVTRALAARRLRNQVFSAFLGETTREDFIPYTADFLPQVEDV